MSSRRDEDLTGLESLIVLWLQGKEESGEIAAHKHLVQRTINTFTRAHKFDRMWEKRAAARREQAGRDG